MDLIVTLVTSHIWPGRGPYTRWITKSTVKDLKITFIQSLFYRLINFHTIYLQEWRLVFSNPCDHLSSEISMRLCHSFKMHTNFYLFLLWFMVDVSRYLLSNPVVFLITHYGNSFVYFWGDLPLEPLTLYLQSLLIWTSLSHLWQVTYDLVEDLIPDELPNPLWRILK